MQNADSLRRRLRFFGSSTVSLGLLGLMVQVGNASALQQRDRPDRPRNELVPDGQLQRAHLAAVRQLYGADTWARGARRQGIPLATLTLPGWEGSAFEASAGRLERSFRRADDPQASPAFVVQAIVCETIDEAHEQLVRWLGGLSSPTLAPSAAARGFALGDAAYIGVSGAGPVATSWVASVRGNVAIRLLNIDPLETPELDLPGLAGRIDELIAQQVELAGNLPCPRPTIDALSASSSSAVAGDVLDLDVAVSDPGGAPHLRWTVSGPGQGYVEQTDGIWQLFTTGPGAITLTLEATGALGLHVTRSIELAVADD